MFEKLENGIAGLRDTDRYRQYLDVMSRFHEYSFRNVLLILEQMPKATAIASFTAWKSMGRSVKKGEHGIRILAPVTYPAKRNVPVPDEGTGLYDREADGSVRCERKEVRVCGFRPVSVFDISQTDGEPLPDIVHELEGDIEGYDRVFNALVKASGVTVRYGDLPGAAYGAVDTETGEVTLRRDLSQAQSIKTLVHEIAHYQMHPPGNKYPRALREVQAESMAYVVSAHFGLDTSSYSLGYLDGWASEVADPELKASLDTVCRNASKLIRSTERELIRAQGKEKKAPGSENTKDTKMTNAKSSPQRNAGEER